jgi:hypothetical protein
LTLVLGHADNASARVDASAQSADTNVVERDCIPIAACASVRLGRVRAKALEASARRVALVFCCARHFVLDAEIDSLAHTCAAHVVGRAAAVVDAWEAVDALRVCACACLEVAHTHLVALVQRSADDPCAEVRPLAHAASAHVPHGALVEVVAGSLLGEQRACRAHPACADAGCVALRQGQASDTRTKIDTSTGSERRAHVIVRCHNAILAGSARRLEFVGALPVGARAILVASGGGRAQEPIAEVHTAAFAAAARIKVG